MTMKKTQAEIRDEAEAQLHDQTDLLPPRELIKVFCVLAMSSFVCFLDQNGVGVSLPNMGQELHATGTIHWAATAASIANTISQMLYGRFSDIFGRKAVLIFALGLLCVADLCCALAPNEILLYTARALAGVANGGISSLAQMVMSDVVSLKRRGKYQGILGSAVGLGSMAGPFVAAEFIRKYSWRGLFFLVSPLALVCGLLCLAVLPKNENKTKFKENIKKVDFLGLVTGSLAIAMILIPISGGGTSFGWDSVPVIIMLVVGGISAVAFFVIEHKYATLPMMPLSMFENPPVRIMLIQNLLFGSCFFSHQYQLPLFFQNARQHSPLISAALMISLSFCQTMSSMLSGQYISHYERYGEVLRTGYFLWALGAGLTCTFSRTTPIWAIVCALGIEGAGVGLVFQPTIVALQAHCAKAQRAVMISNRNVLRSTGGSAGLSGSAAILQYVQKKSLPRGFEQLASSTYSTPDFSTMSERQRDGILNAYATASNRVFIMHAISMGFCLVMSFYVEDRGLQRAEEEEGDKEPETAGEDVEQARSGQVIDGMAGQDEEIPDYASVEMGEKGDDSAENMLGEKENAISEEVEEKRDSRAESDKDDSQTDLVKEVAGSRMLSMIKRMLQPKSC